MPEAPPAPPSRRPGAYAAVLFAIVWREGLRFVHQRARLLAALVRPSIWLLVFAVGVRGALDGAIAAPDGRQIPYETYIVPGLLGMIQLFNGMQSSLSLVADREVGSMRMLMAAPLPRWYLLLCKLLGGVFVSLVQVALFLAIAEATVASLPTPGLLRALPVLLLTGLMLGTIGLLLSSTVRQLENFAGVMNFVIFPMFFMSSALYPLSRVRDSSALLYQLCSLNPFTHAVEAIRSAVYGGVDVPALSVVAACSVVFFLLALWGYETRRLAKTRRRGRALGRRAGTA